jgi:hypothetical protein
VVAAVVLNDPDPDDADVQAWWDAAAGAGGAEAARTAAFADGFVEGAVAVWKVVEERVWGTG